VGNFWQLAGRFSTRCARPRCAGLDAIRHPRSKELPEVVTDSYLHSMMMAGIAAHETTANATANAVKLLLQHPGLARSARPLADPQCRGGMPAPQRLGGRLAAPGHARRGDRRRPCRRSKLLIVTSSANHDEQHFVDADLFDIHRDNASDHLTFGYGSHQCMGKNLARMEMQIFLEEFTRRLPHMQLAEQRFTYVPNTSFRGPEHLWVQWDVAATPSAPTPPCWQRSPCASANPRKAASAAMLVESTELIAAGRAARAPGARRARPAALDAGLAYRPALRRHGHLAPVLAMRRPAATGTYEIAVLREATAVAARPGCMGAAGRHEGADARPAQPLQARRRRQQLILVAGGIGITPISASGTARQALGMSL
jgi:hypothetical protein